MSQDEQIIGGPAPYVLESVERFNLLQYEQASSAYREQLGILIKLVVMFITVDVVLTGFGIRSDEPVAFLFAAITGLTLIITIFGIYRLTIPALCIGVELEDRALNGAKPPLNNQIVTTMVLQELGPKYLESLRGVATEKDVVKRVAKLKALPTPVIGPRVRLLCWSLAFVSVLQLVAFSIGAYTGTLPFSPGTSRENYHTVREGELDKRSGETPKPNARAKTQAEINSALPADDEPP